MMNATICWKKNRKSFRFGCANLSINNFMKVDSITYLNRIFVALLYNKLSSRTFVKNCVGKSLTQPIFLYFNIVAHCITRIQQTNITICKE